MQHKVNIRAFLALAYPVMLAGLSSPLLGLVDQSLLGQFAGSNEIAALSLALVLMSYIFWGFNFISLGLSGHISQALGANDFAAQRKYLYQFATLSFSAAALVLLISPWLVPFFSQMIDQSGELNHLVQDYLSIRIYSTPAIVVSLLGFGWCIGNQDTKKPMLIMISANVLNMLLDWLFCWQFDNKMQAVALGSVIAEYFAASCYGYLLWRQLSKRPAISNWLQPNELWQLVRSSSHFVVRSAFLLSIFAWFNYLSSEQGPLILALNAIYLLLLTLMATGLDGFAHAGEAQIGKAVGANDAALVRDVVRVSFIASLLLAGLLALIMWLGAPSLILLISQDELLSQIAGHYHWAIIVLPLIAFVGYWLDGLFTGLKASKQMRNQVVVASLVYFALTYAFAEQLSNTELWLALIGFMIIRAVFGIWLLKNLLKSVQLNSGVKNPT